MAQSVAEYVPLFKALADETRLKIVGLLSKKQLCACDILEYFAITQPTLSYHMKILGECGLVESQREGAWVHYTLNQSRFEEAKTFLNNLSSFEASLKPTQNC